MSDEQTSQQTDLPPSTPADPWKEVGRQFEALGQSLAAAFRAARDNEENRQRVKTMQTGLESLVNQVGQAIQEAADSPEAHKARTEAEKAADSLRTAGHKTWQESRPHLLSALRQVNTELQKMIGQLEQEASTPKPAAKEAPGQHQAE